jgi:hypothetical protein
MAKITLCLCFAHNFIWNKSENNAIENSFSLRIIQFYTVRNYYVALRTDLVTIHYIQNQHSVL